MAEQNKNSSIKKKAPLFPANFVTLGQLKERRQKEKEEVEKQRKKEEEERLKKVVGEEEAGRQRVKGEPVNRRNQYRRCDRRDLREEHEKLEIGTLCVVTASESVVKEAESEGLKNQKSKESGKWREKIKKKDPAKEADEEVTGGEEEEPPSQTVEKTNAPTRREWVARGDPRRFRPMIGNASEDQTVEIEKKFGGLSLNGANRRDYWYSSRDYGRFRRPGERNSRNASMMWVKKGEFGEGNASEIQRSSDLLSKGLELD